MTKRWRQWAEEAWQRYVRRNTLAPGYERRYSTISLEAAFKCGYDAGVSKARRELVSPNEPGR